MFQRLVIFCHFNSFGQFYHEGDKWENIGENDLTVVRCLIYLGMLQPKSFNSVEMTSPHTFLTMWQSGKEVRKGARFELLSQVLFSFFTQLLVTFCMYKWVWHLEWGETFIKKLNSSRPTFWQHSSLDKLFHFDIQDPSEFPFINLVYTSYILIHWTAYYPVYNGNHSMKGDRESKFWCHIKLAELLLAPVNQLSLRVSSTGLSEKC